MKIAWAFEPSGLTAKQIKSMDALIKALGQTSRVPELIHVEGEIFAGTLDPYGVAYTYPNTRNAKKEITTALKKNKIEIRNQDMRFISTPVSSVADSVEKTVQQAVQDGVDAIALFTHARTGVERLFMGSFAETMVHKSPVDLLLMNPKAPPKTKFKTILYLDDFSEECSKNLPKVIEMCRSQNAKLIVYHVPHMTYSWSYTDEQDVVMKYRNEVNRKREQIERDCKDSGVEVTVILGSWQRPVSEVAMELAAKNKVDLICVLAKVGPFGALLGGSVTRQVIRASNVPVYVLKHHDPMETKLQKSSEAKPRKSRSVAKTPRTPGERIILSGV